MENLKLTLIVIQFACLAIGSIEMIRYWKKPNMLSHVLPWSITAIILGPIAIWVGTL